MATQSKLSPIDPDAIKAVRNAKLPRRPFWTAMFRLILQHTFTSGVAVALAPFVIIKNIFPFLRAHPLWSFKTGTMVELTRIFIYCMGVIRFCPVPNKENGWRETSIFAPILQLLTFSSAGGAIIADKKTQQRLKIKAKRLDRVWFNPPPVDMLRGIISVRVPNKEDQVVRSPRYHGRPLIAPEWAKSRCKAYWYMRSAGVIPPQPSDTEARRRPVLLYIHGGAGVSFQAGDMFMGDCLAKNLARTAGIDVFTVDYDLAPYARYPTTCLQALGAWLYLVRDLRYDPSQVYIGGDSYGAFSTLTLNRWMRDVLPLLDQTEFGGKPVATPGLILLSPWLHNDDEGQLFPSRKNNTKYDIINLNYGKWGTDGLGTGPKYIKTLPLPTSDPWLSLINMDQVEIAELPPLFVGNGGAETLLDEGKTLVEKARKAGVHAEHVVAPGQAHDFYTAPSEVPVAKGHYRRMKLWIAEVEAKKAKA